MQNIDHAKPKKALAGIRDAVQERKAQTVLFCTAVPELTQ